MHSRIRSDTTARTAAKVESAREDAGLTRLDLSEAAGIPYSTLHRKLSGKQSFTLDDIDVIADIFAVDPISLLDFGRAA